MRGGAILSKKKEMGSSSLPKQSELSKSQTEFLKQNLVTHQDFLFRAPIILADLSDCSNDLESHVRDLQKHLTKRIVSWISRSFEAKTSISSLSLMLENRNYSANMEKMITQEMLILAQSLRQIETIRRYADTALRLEVLIGDLEDAVFSSSTKVFSSEEFGKSKHERLLQASKVMTDIEEILVDLVRFQTRWARLLESVDSRVDKCLAVVRPQILAHHRALLASLGWPPKLLSSKVDGEDVVGLPNPLTLMEEENRKKYSESFIALCFLQHLHTKREDRRESFSGPKKCGTRLWTIDELVSPIASRLEYHFSKWAADRPELIFALVYRITRDFIVGVDVVLQPLIDRARLVGLSAKESWVCAMVQMLSGFLAKSLFPYLAERYADKCMRPEVASSWLHLMDHVIAFDKRVRSLVSSESSFSVEWSNKYDGLSILEIFYSKPDWLKIWAKIELKDAWKKLKPILTDEKAWLICNAGGESEDFLLTTREDHRAPLAAESAVKLAWGLIERCQTMPDAGHRNQFIRSAAAKFVWHFMNVLISNCKNTEVPLDNPADASITICASINAARYVESKLHEWSDDVNFLEMTICRNNVDMGVVNSGRSSCFFAEEIKCFAELQTNWLMEIIAILLQHFEKLSQQYLQNKRVFSCAQEDSIRVHTAMDLRVSVDFIQALDALKGLLHILKTNLNALDFLDLWRSAADGLDHYICRCIIDSDFQFSDEGVAQFEADMQAMLSVFQQYCTRPEAFFPFINETLQLLKMDKQESEKFRSMLFNEVKNDMSSYGIRHLSCNQVDRVLRNRMF